MNKKKPRSPSPEEAAVLLYKMKVRGYEGTVERLAARTRPFPASPLRPVIPFSSSSQATDELVQELLKVSRNHLVHGDVIDMDAIADLVVELADTSEPSRAVTRPDLEREKVRERMPPLRAEQLLHLFLSKSDREELIGDLAEEYWTIILPN